MTITDALAERIGRILNEEGWTFEGVHEPGEYDECEDCRRAVYPMAIRIAQEVADAGQISDGYHTFDELYEYRMLYNSHAATGWLTAGYPVVKSWRHSDGELCFGGGWFIVTAELPSGQVSNHYAAKHWELFDVPEVDLPPKWDGHTPQDVARRLRDACAARRDKEEQ
ncbi:WDGH domain-containing protein [Dermabacter hominis]